MTWTKPVVNDADAKSRDGRTSCYQSPFVDGTGNKGSTNSYEEADYFVYWVRVPREISCLPACPLPLPLGFLVCTKIMLTDV